ncbi:unnamed protein product [Rotaria sp. Silwood1]|nr:unnamed protein product [Rotaria sp. Silwood1]CAF4763882.1 unnamed protein product [Rotaria sp. Silwood1]CAF4798181.1 unnamed protein product [Rotaria sp. Silwood1]
MTESVTDHQNIDQLEPSYMYSVLFKEIILEIDEDNAKAVNNLVDYGRQQQVSESQLVYFKRKYHRKSPIWWYTYECFLYGMLNKALRLLDMEAMIKMGFFIRNLHRQLEQVHKEQSDTYRETFIVYRGQGLAQQDFNHLVDTKGGLLSFNNFLSTSKRQKEAMRFVEDALRKYEHNVGVLFIMTIDPSNVSASNTPFALIDDYSAFPQEQEILFSMHTVFRVGEIQQTVHNSRLWEVHLTLTDDNDPQLAALTRRIHGELYGSTAWHRLGHLMLKLSRLSQAEEVYNELLKNSSSDSDKADIYNMLGWLKTDQGHLKEAASFYEKSLKINQDVLPEDHPSLASLYSNIGQVYGDMGDYPKALEFYEKDLEITTKALPANHPDLATSYTNIGFAYKNMGDYSKALEFYEKALEIDEKTLPPNHPHLAISYNNIGEVYNSMNDYSKALEFYDKALKIKEKSLPSNHPGLAVSKHDIGLVYETMGQYSKASEFYALAVEIAQLSLSSNHPHLQLYRQDLQNVKKKI